MTIFLEDARELAVSDGHCGINPIVVFVDRCWNPQDDV